MFIDTAKMVVWIELMVLIDRVFSEVRKQLTFFTLENKVYIFGLVVFAY